MKKIIIAIASVVLLNNLSAMAQKEEETYTVVERMPEFKGGNDEMYKFLSENLKYPKEAKAKNVQGTVFVKFIVDTTGKCINPEIARGVSEELDNEAKRVISLMNFTPGYQSGKRVKVQFILPVTYKLTDK